VVDQFEEVFTMIEDEDARDHFLRSLVAAVREPRARLRIVTTLRADFYDRPLSYPGLAELTQRRNETVVPLTPEELERAIGGPADRVGVVPERALVAEMVADVSDRPGGLPLLQYALTELFDRRRDGALTLEAYREIDGISGALARRAEELFEASSGTEREAAKQLFLRLVTSGEGQADTRRLVPRAELMSLQGDPVAMQNVIDRFGRHRLLSFDRDPATRGPTVEVAHEALLGSWERLRIWIDEARDALRQHRRLATAATDWETSGRDRSLLLRGSRLEQLHTWTGSTDLALSRDEQEFLSASIRQRDQERVEERTRAERERALERRSFLRLRALVAVLTVAALIAAGLTTVAVSRAREAERRRDEAAVAGLTGAALSQLRTDPELSLLLAIHAVDLSSSLERPVPAATVEALHWAIQEAGVEYPVPDGPVAVVTGPLGTRGVFDLPLSQLMEAARSGVERSLTASECSRFFGTPTCRSSPPSTPPSGLVAEPLNPAGGTTPGQPLAGTEVAVLFGRDAEPGSLGPLRRQLDEFTSGTGIEVTLVDFPEMDNFISEREAEGDPPDLALQQPGVVVDLARKGHLADMGTFLDVERLRTDQSPYLVSLGTIGPDGSWPSDNGRLYGAFADLNLKSRIWYPVPELRAAGYVLPRTWTELTALSDELLAAGRTPWCLGFESGTADGWPGTDWIENLLLAGAGTEAYDRWTFHELPFDSPPVRKAFERFDEIVFTQGSVRGGTEGALETGIRKAQLPMVAEDPPGCWLLMQPSFSSTFLPKGSVGKTTDVFSFPTIAGGVPRLIGGGNMLAAFADRPEVRELVRFILSPSYGTQLVGVGSNFMSANRRFDLENYPPFLRRQARVLEAALAADTFRFDASDLMPPRVGAEPFWGAMMTYLRHGPRSLDRILAGLDARWPDDG
jgi:ABC-type glycerol-3-phosphate transport system substrate-binding protein